MYWGTFITWLVVIEITSVNSGCVGVSGDLCVDVDLHICIKAASHFLVTHLWAQCDPVNR